MRPITLSRALATLACAVLAACGDSRSTAPIIAADAAATVPQANLAVAASCSPTTISGLIDAANLAFGEGSPDAQSVIGKLGQLNDLVVAQDGPGARTKALEIIEFTLKKNAQRALPGGEAAVISFVNAVACFAGLNFSITTTGSTFFIFPTDGPQILRSADGFAAISLPANPVSEPSLIHIEPIRFVGDGVDVGLDGKGPLGTKLDQYRGFYDFGMASVSNNKLLARRAIIEICAPSGIAPDVFARLRLGHQAAAGFQIEPRPDAAVQSFVNCTAYASADPVQKGFGLLGRVASLFTPRVAFAATTMDMFYGGGVGGTVIELSPFAPVDPLVSMSGGVGGTVIELQTGRQSSDVALSIGRSSAMDIVAPSAAPGCSNVLPIGSSFTEACRPSPELKTPTGTVLVGVPITFAVATASGSVAAEGSGAVCVVPFAPSVIVNTSVTGVARACWTLGTFVGEQILVATPGVGGDVPAGVTFSPATLTRTVTATAPTAVIITQQPAENANIIAGTNIPVTVAVVDLNGVTVPAFTGEVTLTLNKNSFASGASIKVNAVAGVATFTGVSINKAATAYALTATASYTVGNPFSITGNSFNIVATSGAGSTLTITGGNGQIGDAGSLLPIRPTVLLKDKFDNPINGATINWSAGGSSGGSVDPATSTTALVGNQNGIASTAWTIGAGSNELLASYGTDATALFTATVKAPPPNQALKTLSQCDDGPNAGDAFASGPELTPTSTAFFIPDFTQAGNMSGTIREISVRVAAAGTASGDKEYELGLIVQRGSFDITAAPPVTIRSKVFLRGSAGGTGLKTVTFQFDPALVKPSGTTATQNIMLDLVVLQRPATGAGNSILFNTGPCGTGTKCTMPNICKATQVDPTTPSPLGTLRRRSVSILVRGT